MITHEELMRHIIGVVYQMQGCKLTDLTHIVDLRIGVTLTRNQFMGAIDHLTSKGLLIALEYRLPDSPGRINMFVLPGNTRARLVPSHEG